MHIVELIQIITLCSVAFVGMLILGRLPRRNSGPSFRYGRPELSLSLQMDALTEQEFEIGYVDDWHVGRSFLIGGLIKESSDPKKQKTTREIFGDRERVVLEIRPQSVWFKSSVIGFLRTYSGPAAEPSINLPYQLAYQLLNELRRDQNQIVSIDFAREITRQGKEVFRVYSIRLASRD